MKKLLTILITAFFAISASGQLSLINVGTTAGDGTGDTLRTAFRKTNLGITQINTNTGNILLRLPIADTTLMLTKYARKASPTFTGLLTTPSLKVGTVKTGSQVAQLDSITTDGTSIYFYNGATILSAVPGTGSATWGTISGTLADQVDLKNALDLKAPLASPTFTGTVSGITAAMVSAMSTSHVANAITSTNISNWNTSYNWGDHSAAGYALSSALSGYVPTSRTVNGHLLTGNVSVTAADVSLGNVTNESKETMFTSPTLTGTVTLPATTSIGDVSDTEIGYVNGLNGTAASRQNINDSLAVYLAGATTGIALADSTGNAEGNYMTRQGTRQEISDSINLALAGAETGIALADSTGNAAGNYMTRENYLTYSSQSNLLKTLKNFGVGIKALPVGFTYVSGTYTLSENRIYTVLTYLNRGEPITGAKWYSNVAGDFVADSINAFNGVALYKCDAAGTTSTKVAVSANNANIWRAQVQTIASAAFTSQYVATEGYHYIAFMYNYTEQTVAPKIYGDTGLHLTLINNLVSDSKDVVGYVGTQATFPDTIAASSITGLTNGLPFILLY